MNLNFLRKFTQKTGIYYRLADFYLRTVVKPKYERIAKINRLKLEEIKSKSKVLLSREQALSIKNSLSNSGGIPIAVDEIDLTNLNSDIIKKESRKTGIQNFEGMALNDAVAVEKWKHFSFFDLAMTISQIAKLYFGKESFSILELGCGAGSMFEYFKVMGASLYIGLDGNPLAFEHSPIISRNSEFFKLVNLQEEINFSRPFDIIYTSEVLEHIREDYTDIFLSTISNHMDKDSLFLGTIALTRMDVHINVHPKVWWLHKFREHGLYQFERSAEMETRIAMSSPYNWNKNTSHIFALKKR